AFSIVGIMGIFNTRIGPYKIIVALEFQSALLEREIIQLKSVTSRICCPALVIIILIDQLGIVPDAIMQGTVQFKAIGVIIHQVAFFISRSRYAADTGKLTDFLVSINIKGVAGRIVFPSLAHWDSIVYVGIIGGKPIETGKVGSIDLKGKTISYGLGVSNGNIVQGMWIRIFLVKMVHAHPDICT